MTRHTNIRAALFACALILGPGAAFADSTFDFITLPAGVTDGSSLDNAANTVTVGLVNSSAKATFSDPNASGDFVFTAYGGVPGLNAPVILSDSGGNGTSTSDVLDIKFSQAISTLTFTFGLGNGLTGGDTLNASLFNGGSQVGAQLFIGAADDTGTFALSVPVTEILLTATTSAANGNNYATVNLEPATVAAVPEPAGWALMSVGLIGLIASIAIKRRQA